MYCGLWAEGAEQLRNRLSEQGKNFDLFERRYQFFLSVANGQSLVIDLLSPNAGNWFTAKRGKTENRETQELTADAVTFLFGQNLPERVSVNVISDLGIGDDDPGSGRTFSLRWRGV